VSNTIVRTLRSAVAAIAAAATLALVGPRLRADPSARLDFAALLDLYAAGQHDEAIAAVERASDDDAKAMRLWWSTIGRRWIDANPAERRQRLLAVAAFALEVEQVRVERGQWLWGPFQETRNGGHTVSGKRVLNWAAACLVERGAPDEAEHAWWLAAIALVQGLRDAGALYGPSSGLPIGALIIMTPARGSSAPAVAPQPTPGLPVGFVVSALARYPDDPQFRLARAMARAAPYDVTADGGPRSPAVNDAVTVRPGRITGSQGDLGTNIGIRINGLPAPLVSNALPANRARYAELGNVAADFASLAGDPVVGIEARVRLGYLYWATGDDARARTELSTAAAAAVDPDLRYLAHFLLGVVAQSGHDTDAAAAAFRAALDARPKSQSASLALAAIELRRGNGGRAYELAQGTLETSGDADPWRLFLYGRYPQWPALRTALRRLVTQ
jgi:tetratricopeptide (TPR) repeat protein